MTTYNKSANIRTANVSQTQNVNTTDTVRVTLSTHYTPNVETSDNATVTYVSGTNPSSTNSTITWDITFIQAGTYEVVLHQAYFNKRYTLTGTATGATNYGYGLQVYDASGTPRMGVLKRQPRIVGFISGTGGGSTFNQYFSGFNQPSSAEWTAVSVEPGSNYFVTQGTTNNYFEATRADVRTTNSSYQVLTGNESYKFIILRY